MSHTGILFRTNQLLEMGTPIEFIVTMPRVLNEPGYVSCQGTVVRVTRSAASGETAMAASIGEFCFLRGTDLPPP